MKKYFLTFSFLFLAMASAMAQKTAIFEYANFLSMDGKDKEGELWTKKGIAKNAFSICTPEDKRPSVTEAYDDKATADVSNFPFVSFKGGDLVLYTSDKHPEASFDKTKDDVVAKEVCAAAVGQWATKTSFIYESRITFKPESNEDFAGILLYVDDHHVMEFGVSCDEENNPCLRIKASLGEFQVGSKTWKINTTKNIKLRAVVENGHVYFRYLIGGGIAWRNVGMPVSTDHFVAKEGDTYKDLMVGLFAVGHE